MGLLELTVDGFARTTSLGERMLAGHMDVTLNLLVALAEALHIRDIGLVAAAYILCKKEVFSDLFLSARELGLSSAQVALGEHIGFPVSLDNPLAPVCGDVHTAVRWYLEWIAYGNDLPASVDRLFRLSCFRKMAKSAPILSPEKAKQLLSIPHWRGALTICILSRIR